MTAFKQGYKAFKEGHLGNPFPTNTEKNRNWELGFNRAYFENRERVVKKEQQRDGKDFGRRSR